MAGSATTLLKFQGESPDNLAYEVWTASIGGAETECDITATYLDSVEFVTITPANAAAAATVIGYLKPATFVPGQGAELSIVGAANCEYLVKLEGRIA